MKKILICDDSMTVRKKLISAVNDIGEFELLEAKDGINAFKMYKTHKPDLVFMDIMMPVMTGLEAAEAIMGYDSTAHIVMLSSVGTKTNLQKALKAGAQDFIQKPFDREKLETILSHFVGEE